MIMFTNSLYISTYFKINVIIILINSLYETTLLKNNIVMLINSLCKITKKTVMLNGYEQLMKKNLF